MLGRSLGKAETSYTWSSRSLLKRARMGEKWGLFPKGGDGGMTTERPRDRPFSSSSSPAPGGPGAIPARKSLVFTPAPCLHAINQAAPDVPTSFQWKLVVLRFPPEPWCGLGPPGLFAWSGPQPPTQLSVGDRGKRNPSQIKDNPHT